MSEWISVKTMPDMAVNVILHTEDGVVDAGYDDGQDFRFLSGGKVDSPVTHWMPYPNPPEGQK
jgi:hypothetical protein